LDDDMLGQSLSAIRQLSGAVNLVEGNAVVSLGAKSVNAEQAKALEETLGGLQAFGKSLLSGTSSDKKKVYAKMLDSAKITRAGTEVAIDLQVPSADLGLLIK
jgi:hypothetical protein